MTNDIVRYPQTNYRRRPWSQSQRCTRKQGNLVRVSVANFSHQNLQYQEGEGEFLSQTNTNPEDAGDDEIYKFVDDKSVIEVINLFSIGLASHNVKAAVPSNIPVTNNFIPSEHLKTQSNMERVESWAEGNQMKLNILKTKNTSHHTLESSLKELNLGC